MESKYNIENFERFLREKSDEFRMYPSKRVWYSIYNNMHPGNRLPSISMSIILIFALLLVGYLNTDSSKQLSIAEHNTKGFQVNVSTSRMDNPTSSNKSVAGSTPQNPANQQILFVANPSPVQTDFTIQSPGNPKGSSTRNNNSNDASLQQSASYTNNRKHPVSNRSGSKTGIANAAATTPGAPSSKINMEGAAEIETSGNVYTPSKLEVTTVIPTDLAGAKNTEVGVKENNSAGSQNSNSKKESANTDKIDLIAIGAINKTDVASAIAAIIADSDKNDAENKINNKPAGLSETDKAWIENFALYNRKAPKKWAGKVSWQAYITPSVVYRNLHNNTAGKFPGSNTGNFNNTDVNDAVNHNPSVGIETGIALQYDLLRRVKVKAGVQLNYTRYNAHAFENYHPIASSLGMNSDNGEAVYEVFRTTPFSNGAGLTPVKLHNETYQISLPIGADFKLAAFDNLEWYVGATVQPTIIVYGRSYLISTDRRNYVQDPSMLNRFNLNAGLETYISFKTTNYTWQIGPQFRSQIFSTNSKLYSVEERLQNFGFKIGISKKL